MVCKSRTSQHPQKCLHNCCGSVVWAMQIMDTETSGVETGVSSLSFLPPQAQNLSLPFQVLTPAGWFTLSIQVSHIHTTALRLRPASPCCKGRTLNHIQDLPALVLHEAPVRLLLSLSGCTSSSLCSPLPHDFSTSARGTGGVPSIYSGLLSASCTGGVLCSTTVS